MKDTIRSIMLSAQDRAADRIKAAVPATPPPDTGRAALQQLMRLITSRKP